MLGKYTADKIIKYFYLFFIIFLLFLTWIKSEMTFLSYQAITELMLPTINSEVQ